MDVDNSQGRNRAATDVGNRPAYGLADRGGGSQVTSMNETLPDVATKLRHLTMRWSGP